jgi:hypothetical protein
MVKSLVRKSGFRCPLDSARSQTGGTDIDFPGLTINDHPNALQVRHPPSFGHVMSVAYIAARDGYLPAYFAPTSHICLPFCRKKPFSKKSTPSSRHKPAPSNIRKSKEEGKEIFATGAGKELDPLGKKF